MTNFPRPRELSNKNVTWKEKDRDKNSGTIGPQFPFSIVKRRVRAFSAEMIESSLFPVQSIDHSKFWLQLVRSVTYRVRRLKLVCR